MHSHARPCKDGDGRKREREGWLSDIFDLD
jgi:hypothetical protein